MRFARTIALAGVGLLWLGFGPVVLLLAGLLLAWRPVRAWLRPTRRVLAIWVASLAAFAGLAVVVPDGWIRIPPGAGALVTPGYLGRPARPAPVAAQPAPPPHLARPGLSGPLGESPKVRTRSYGFDSCPRLSFDSHGRLVTLCAGPDAPALRVIDPDSLRRLASKELPAREDDPCPGAFYLDDRDRAVVATDDRRLLVVGTDDAEGDADLTTQATVKLSGELAADDCVTGLLPDRQGRTWFATRAGLVGLVAADGTARVVDLGEEVANPPAADRDGTYVVTVEALYRLEADAAGRPAVVWRTPYDRGSRHKPGQATQGSGSAPVVLASGLVAITDNADPQMRVVLHRPSDGAVVCQTGVFGDDEGATDGGLTALGDGVLATNSYGYRSPLSTGLGRSTPGGLARVTERDGECVVTWTADLAAPSSPPAVAAETGLVYAWTKRHSWLGASAWYLTALEARTGRTAFAVRGGLGFLRDSHHGAVAVGPDGSVFVPVLGGLVRIHDRE